MTADFFFLIFGVLVVVCGFLQWVIRQRAQVILLSSPLSPSPPPQIAARDCDLRILRASDVSAVLCSPSLSLNALPYI
jgi:hypothetical protein